MINAAIKMDAESGESRGIEGTAPDHVSRKTGRIWGEKIPKATSKQKENI